MPRMPPPLTPKKTSILSGVAPAATGLALVSVDSVKGGFAIDLPLTGTRGVECRSGGRQGSYTIDFTFNNNLISVASVMTSCGTVTSSMIDATDSHRESRRRDLQCSERDCHSGLA